MSENTNNKSWDFHCERLGADGVASNLKGEMSWDKWGQPNIDSIKSAGITLETLKETGERIGVFFQPVESLIEAKHPVSGKMVATGKKAIFNPMHDNLLGVVGEKFNALPHYETLKEAFGVAIDNNVTPSRLISFNGGAAIMAQFLIDQKFYAAGREHRAFLTMYNAIDGTSQAKAGHTLYTPVCCNTKAAAMRDLAYGVKHTVNFVTNLSKLREQLDLEIKAAETEIQELDRWGNIPVSNSLVADFKAFIMPKKEGSKSKAADNRQESFDESLQLTLAEVDSMSPKVYDLEAAFTRYIKDRIQNRTGEEQYQYVTMGAGAQAIESAHNWLVDYVNNR